MTKPTASVSEALILENGHLVTRAAHGLLRYMPAHVELDDLVQAGMVGLLEAAGRYTACGGAAFATFATHRIRGAMLDALRDTDWSPRSLRRKRRDIEAARRRVEIDTCSAPRPRAVAVALGVTLDTYYGIIRDASLSQLLSLDELASTSGTNIGPIDENPLPDAALEHEETLRALMAGVHALPECDHTLLRLLYAEEYLLREIAELLAVTESRVCQIHKRIIEKLRVVTRKNLNGRVNSAGVTSRRQCRSRALPAPAASG